MDWDRREWRVSPLLEYFRKSTCKNIRSHDMLREIHTEIHHECIVLMAFRLSDSIEQ